MLHDPDRLLSAVLLWNLAINMTYFGISSIVGLQLERRVGGYSAVAFSSRFVVDDHLLQRDVAQESGGPQRPGVAGLVGIPVALCVRIVDPVMPTLRSDQTCCPAVCCGQNSSPRQYLEVSDLERAIEMSTQDAQLIEQERAVLSNIVMLSDIPCARMDAATDSVCGFPTARHVCSTWTAG